MGDRRVLWVKKSESSRWAFLERPFFPANYPAFVGSLPVLVHAVLEMSQRWVAELFDLLPTLFLPLDHLPFQMMPG